MNKLEITACFILVFLAVFVGYKAGTHYNSILIGSLYSIFQGVSTIILYYMVSYLAKKGVV